MFRMGEDERCGSAQVLETMGELGLSWVRVSAITDFWLAEV